MSLFVNYTGQVDLYLSSLYKSERKNCLEAEVINGRWTLLIKENNGILVGSCLEKSPDNFLKICVFETKNKFSELDYSSAIENAQQLFDSNSVSILTFEMLSSKIKNNPQASVNFRGSDEDVPF